MKNIKKLVSCVLVVLLLAAVAFMLLPHIQRMMYPLEYAEYITKYAGEYNIPAELVCAIIRTESHFDKDAVSGVGAMGLMQLMPDTYQWIADKLGEPTSIDNIADPETNIKYGSYYLKYLYERFGNWETVVAAYNAGPNKVADWLTDERYSNDKTKLKNIPITETKNYVNRVFSAEKQYKELYFKGE